MLNIIFTLVLLTSREAFFTLRGPADWQPNQVTVGPYTAQRLECEQPEPGGPVTCGYHVVAALKCSGHNQVVADGQVVGSINSYCVYLNPLFRLWSRR